MGVANIAKRMIKQWGMSEKVGLVALEADGQRPPSWGGNMMSTGDAEVERLVNNSYVTAMRLVTENKPLLDHLAKTLVEQEVVSAEEFQMMLVEFNVQTERYAVIGEERNREKLPFQ